MASGRDVREMLGLPMGGDAPKAAIQKRPKAAGATRKIRTSDISLSRAYGVDNNVG
jgi:DNA methyltransferase 1-associated protein 1